MKKLLLPLALAFASNAAMAANSVDLRVTGTITPAACDITLPGGGTIDFGNITTAELDASNETIIGSSRFSINVTCSSPTLVGTRLIDNRAGTSHDPRGGLFGVGVDSGGNNIGNYSLDFETATVDSGIGQSIISVDGGLSWQSMRNSGIVPFENGTIVSWHSGVLGNLPESLTTVTQVVDATLRVAPLNSLDTSQEITIDGSATIELVYL